MPAEAGTPAGKLTGRPPFLAVCRITDGLPFQTVYRIAGVYRAFRAFTSIVWHLAMNSSMDISPETKASVQ